VSAPAFQPDPRRSCEAWDHEAEAAGIVIGARGYASEGARVLGFPRPVGPARNPSPRCRSGRQPYCTCDTCF
jgi:hypothetical protein